MDNTNDNLGSAAPTGTTAPTTQAASEGSAQKPDTAGSSTADNLILGKFKTTDDLAKSYQELERERGAFSAAKADAELLQKLADKSKTPIDELKKQIQQEIEDSEMKESGVSDPVVFRMQKQMETMEAQLKQSAFENEFAALKAQYPALDSVKDSIKQVFLTSKGKTLGQIAQDLYVPVLVAVEQQAVAKLNDKEASNALAPKGNVQYAVTEQELVNLRNAAASGSTDAIAKYMAAKQNASK